MSSRRKQANVTNFRQYQAPPANKIATSNPGNKSYYSYSQTSYGYSQNNQKNPNEERVPLNLTNYRANLMPNNTSNEKLNLPFSPILSYQFSHRINYSKNVEKKDDRNPNFISKPYTSNNIRIAANINPVEESPPKTSFQIAKSSSNNKDSESYFRPTSYHLKYSSVMTNFQYKDDYKPTEYVTKSSAASSQLLKTIQEQNQNQVQNQNQSYDPNSNDQEKKNFDYNASLFFAKQALLNGSGYKQYRPDDFDQKDSSQPDLNQNYDLSKNSQQNYNPSQFNLNNNDNNNVITSYHTSSNNNKDKNYKSSFNFNNNNDIYSNDSKSNYVFNNTNDNKNNYVFNNNNNNENEFDDEFLTKLKKSISSSVSGENPNAKSNGDPKYDRDSFTSFHLQKNNNSNNHSFDEETITIDIPKKKERIDPIPVQDGNENGLDLQAKLAKFRQTISLVRKTEEDYGELFPQEKHAADTNNEEKESEETMLKDTTNDMLSEPSLIFADSQNQS